MAYVVRTPGSKMLAPSTGRAVTEWVLIVGMLLILFSPLSGKTLGWPAEVDLKEHRPLATPPQWGETSWGQLPAVIDLWWNDHFAFRTQIIPLQEWVRMDLLGAPGTNYVRGKGGHLFMNFPYAPGSRLGATVEDYLGTMRLSAAEVSDWTE